MSFLTRVYGFKFFDAFILIFPLYAVMFVDAGLTPVQISVALTAWSATAFALEIPAGVVADRLPRRLVLAVAQAGRAAGFVVWLFYPHFWGFLAGLVLWGVKSAFTSGTFEALLFDELKAEGRAGDYVRVVGRARAAQAVAVLCASFCAAAVARFGYPLALAASLASIAAAMVFALSLPQPPRALAVHDRGYIAHLGRGLAEAARQPAVLGIIVFGALILALGGSLEEFWPIFGAKVGLARPLIAVFVGIQYGGEALASLAAHRLERLGRRWFYALLIVAGGLLTAAATIFTPAAMALLAVYSALLKLTDVVFEARLQHAVASENRATIGSVKGFAAQIGVAGLYLSFGPAAQLASYRVAFLGCGVVVMMVGAAYLATLAPGKIRRKFSA